MQEMRSERVYPPEIMALKNYFVRTYPSYLGDEGLDGTEDKTYSNWLKMQGHDLERSIREYIAFKPRVSAYRSLSLEWDAYFLLGAFRQETTFLIVDSGAVLPKDSASLERVRAASLEHSIRIVEEISKGVYHDIPEDIYYRLEVDETWWGSADDAATYGAYHVRRIKKDEALEN